MTEAHLVWLHAHADVSRITAQVWHGPMAQFVSSGNSKADPRKIHSVLIEPEDRGLTVRHLMMIEKYALPTHYLKTIDQDRKIETKPKLTKDEADRLGVSIDGKPVATT